MRARIGEAWHLRWIDVDSKNRAITCQPEKGGKPRKFRVSEKLIRMINALPKRNQLVFSGTSLGSHRTNFSYQRKRLAKKLQNPRLQKTHFHTLRHWKATMEYHKTKDALHIKELLGYRSIESTMKYIQLAKFEEPEEFTCRIAKDMEEAKELVEAGFEYVTGEYDDGGKIFRKRK